MSIVARPEHDQNGLRGWRCFGLAPERGCGLPSPGRGGGSKAQGLLGLTAVLAFGGFTATSAQEPTDEEILAKDGAVLELFPPSQRCLYFPRAWCLFVLDTKRRFRR